MNFLAGKLEKSVKLERLLGIGGEGVVLSAKMTTIERFIDYEKGSETKEGREVAIKFVKFERDENEALDGLKEEEDERGEYGGIFGSPERPLSDLGLISYRSYWKDVIVHYILNLQPDQKFSVRELSLQSGILQNDLVSTLQFMQV